MSIEPAKAVIRWPQRNGTTKTEVVRLKNYKGLIPERFTHFSRRERVGSILEQGLRVSSHSNKLQAHHNLLFLWAYDYFQNPSSDAKVGEVIVLINSRYVCSNPMYYDPLYSHPGLITRFDSVAISYSIPPKYIELVAVLHASSIEILHVSNQSIVNI